MLFTNKYNFQQYYNKPLDKMLYFSKFSIKPPNKNNFIIIIIAFSVFFFYKKSK